MTDKKKILITIAGVLFLGIAFILLNEGKVAAVGTWFLKDEFTVYSAQPLTSPRITTDGQSVVVSDADPLMSISVDNLNMRPGTPNDGSMGMRYNSSASVFAGRTIFFKVDFISVANGVSAQGNLCNVFGFTNGTDVTFDDIAKQGVGVNATSWRAQLIENTNSFFDLPATTNLTDTFYVAVILGGAINTATNETNTDPWYSGVAASGYTRGHFVFIRKGWSGVWKLVGKNISVTETNSYPAFSNYNSWSHMDYWAVTNDTLRDDFMQPIMYHDGNVANGTQLFDDASLVGASFDSVHGDWQGSSGGNSFLSAGSVPATVRYVTTADLNETDVFIEVAENANNGATGRDAGIVLRRNSSNDKFVLAVIEAVNGTTGNLRIYTFDGSAYTLRATTSGVNITSSTNFKYLSAWISDSTVQATFYQNANNAATVAYTSELHTFYGNGAHDEHGLYSNLTGIPEYRDFRAYAVTGYDSLTAYFPNDAVRENQYSLIDKLTFSYSDDPNPINSPHVSDQEKNWWLVQSAGTTAITNQRLVIGGSATNNQHGLRREYFTFRNFGTIQKGIVMPTSKANGANGDAFLSNMIGYTFDTSLLTARYDEGSSWGWTASGFGMFAASNAAGVNFPRREGPLTVVLNNDFGFAHVLGGYSGESDAATPYYAGLTKSSYTSGAALFIRQSSSSGNWLRQVHSYADYPSTSNLWPMYCAIENDWEMDAWILGTDIDSTLLSADHFSSFTGANGTNIYSLTPEVGNAFQSSETFGSMQVTSNRIVPSGTVSGDNRFFMSAADFGFDDGMVEATVNLSSGENASVLMRVKASDESCVVASVSNVSNTLFLITYSGGAAGTQTILASAGFSPVDDNDFILGGHCYEDTCMAYAFDVGSLIGTSVKATTTHNNTETMFGIKTNSNGPTTPQWDNFRVYKIYDSHYDDVLNNFGVPAVNRRKWIIR